MATIHGIGLTADAITRDAFYDGVFDELVKNERDFPFVLTFTVKKAVKSKRRRGTSPTRISLHRKIGVPNGHVFAPSSADMADGSGSSDSGTVSTQRPFGAPVPLESPPVFMWPFAECLESGETILVSSLGAEAEKLDPRSWNRNCRSACVGTKPAMMLSLTFRQRGYPCWYQGRAPIRRHRWDKPLQAF